MIPLLDISHIFKLLETDSWGIRKLADVGKEVNCKISYNIKEEVLELEDGRKIVITASIYYEGIEHVAIGDVIKFTDVFGVNHEMEVVGVKPIIDLSGAVLYTKVLI